MGPRENPVLVARGLDPIPSGFDAGNHASCTFARPISAVKLELLRDGKTVVQQVIPMNALTTDVRFPLSETPTQPIGADLDTGGYDHRITAATEDGEEAEVLFNADAIWVLDPDSSPKDLARRAVIAAREAYAKAQAVPYIGPAVVAFEPVEWGDASLGCPKAGRDVRPGDHPGLPAGVRVRGPTARVPHGPGRLIGRGLRRGNDPRTGVIRRALHLR